MNDYFDDIINDIIKLEGGYSNSPYDKGGHTNFGISTNRVRGIYGMNKRDAESFVRNLTIDQAKDIYRKYYWDANRIGEISDYNKALATMDAIVQHGKGSRLIQSALNQLGNSIKVDGRIGDITLQAINDANADNYFNTLSNIRRNYYNSIVQKDPRQQANLQGWNNRVTNLGEMRRYQQQQYSDIPVVDTIDILGQAFPNYNQDIARDYLSYIAKGYQA